MKSYNVDEKTKLEGEGVAMSIMIIAAIEDYIAENNIPFSTIQKALHNAGYNKLHVKLLWTGEELIDAYIMGVIARSIGARFSIDLSKCEEK